MCVFACDLVCIIFMCLVGGSRILWIFERECSSACAKCCLIRCKTNAYSNRLDKICCNILNVCVCVSVNRNNKFDM